MKTFYLEKLERTFLKLEKNSFEAAFYSARLF